MKFDIASVMLDLFLMSFMVGESLLEKWDSIEEDNAVMIMGVR